MAPYNYNNFYDPVGSQSSNQPHGYTYQTNSASQYPSQATSNYQASYNQNYGSAYANQQYGTNTQPPAAAATATNSNASNLNSLSTSTYPQNSTSNRSGNSSSTYDTNTYYASTGFAGMTDRNQSNNSPLYSSNTTGASTFGKLSLPDQSQSSSATYGRTQSYQNSASNASTQYRNAPSSAISSRVSHKTAYNQSQNQVQPPQRYASPIHAAQAQQQHHGHSKQPSRSSNPKGSPQMSVQNLQQMDRQYQRQTSASVEPSPTTVDPTQIYDMRAEQQRKAQIEADKRKQRETERAARKAEEDARKQEEERRVADEAARKETQQRQDREKREAEEQVKEAEEEAARKKATQDRKNAQRRKAREEMRQSQTAATALTQMASGSAAATDAGLAGMPGLGDMSAAPANEEEAEMRAMFKKMREFNARNPAMLAKLWEEERQTHASQTGSPAQPTAKPAQTAAASEKQQPPQATPAHASQANNAGQQIPGIRPFKSINSPVPVASQHQAQQPFQKAATQQGNGSLWPPHKKGSLAEAATKWLNNLQPNRTMGRSIGKETVVEILDTNPSYVQLCEALEGTGIKFERSDLAKELLKAVPDVRPQKQGGGTAAVIGLSAQVGNPLNSDAQKRKPGRPKKDQPGNYSMTKPSQGNGPVQYQAPVFSLSNAAREVNSMSSASTLGGPSSLAAAIANAAGPSDLQSPYSMDQPIVDDSVPVEDSGLIEIKDEGKPPEELPKPPADKEEAARKRTFNDLVDLTKDNDSDDEGPPRKIQQPIAGPSHGAVKYQAPPQPNGFGKPMTFQQFLKSTYHGPMQSPSHYQTPHGFNQMQNQPQPPVPVVPSKSKQMGPTEEQKQQERMRGKMLVEPVMRDRVARKSKYDSRTIARDVLLATGRHPDMRPLNAHLSTMQKILADHGGAVDGTGNKSDLSTIKWDIIDPGEPAEDTKAKVKSAAERREKAIAPADDDTEADDEGEGLPSRAQEALRKIRNGEEVREEALSSIEDPMVRKQIKNRLKVRQQSERYKQKGGEEGQDRYVSVRQQQSADTSGANPKRKGRPPKSATNGQRASPAVHHAPSNDDNNGAFLASDLTPNKSRKPRASQSSQASPPMSGGKPVGYAAFQHFDENGNPIKKKGRPVGWRKSIHSREAHGLDPAKTGGNNKPPGSRLRQSAGPTAADSTLQPQYQVYKCRWTDCGAQLDNLERLKKHVVKIHGAKMDDNQFECRWQPCRFQGKHVDEGGKAHAGDDGITSFDTIEHWMKHIQKEHIDEVAWKLGDGPRGGSVSEQHTDSEAYRSDAKGRSITPIIVPLTEHTGDASFTILMSNLKGYDGKGKAPMTFGNGITAKEAKERREAEAELQKLTDKRKAEGLTMGREGSRLATDKRRRGFLDDEDFEDVIIESD